MLKALWHPIRWVKPRANQRLPVKHTLLIIELHHGCCGPPGRCQSDDLRANQLEVFLPALCARIEEWCNVASQGINRSDVRAFSVVAESASQGQILTDCRPAMFERDDMVNLMSLRPVILMQETVFTSFARAFNDQSAQFIGEVRAGHKTPVKWD